MPYHQEEFEKNGVFISEVVDRREEVDDGADTDRPIASVTDTLKDQDEDDNVRRSG